MMTILEKKKMIVGAIRKLEDKLVNLQCHFDPSQTLSEREAEKEATQRHLRSAHGVLVMLTEEEIEAA